MSDSLPPREEVERMAEVWDQAHQRKVETVGACLYEPSCVERGVHPNPFRKALAWRFPSGLAPTGER